MSLHTLAHHLQKAGRGEDKVLVHMTPGEVKGLQSLAMAHGGSLTINPQTGLPEAGILSAILPMVAGFFLGPAGLGLTAMQSALAVGALGTAATGSLGKGFMMGMGAYGGAGLGAGLSSAGAAAPATGSGASYGSWAASDAGKLAAEQAASSASNYAAANTVGTGATNAATNGLNALSPASPFAKTAVDASSFNTQFMPGGSMANVAAPPVDAASLIAKTPATQSVFTTGTPNGIEAGSIRQTALDQATADSIAAQQKAGITSNMPSKWDNVSSGFKKATNSWDDFKDVWDKTPKGTGYGLAATGIGVLQAQQEEAAEKAKAEAAALAAARRGTVRPYKFSVEQNPSAYANTSTAESDYFFEPRFEALPTHKAAEGGTVDSSTTLALPDRPPMEQASDAQAIGRNNSFPMSHIRQPAYSTPSNRPLSQEVIDPSGAPEIDPYSGEPKFAAGGIATLASGGAATMGGPSSKDSKTQPKQNLKYTFNPDTMQYTKTETVYPEVKNTNPWGLGGDMLHPNNFGYGGTNMPSGWANGYGVYEKQKAPDPIVTTEKVGGIMAPYIPPGQAPSADQTAAPAMGLGSAQNMPMVPNIQIPQAQSVNQQLGLESFYPMMEQQLAMKGSQLQSRGFAEGGVTGTGGIDLHIPIDLGGTTGYNTMAGNPQQSSQPFFNDYLQNSGKTDPIESAVSAYQNQQQGLGGFGSQEASTDTGGFTQQQAANNMNYRFAAGGMAHYGLGGVSHLGDYSDGGRLLRGPGDGVSDSIPASIGNRQPARLADGEFVVPARIVSEIGNGSTEAGARKLYAMMDRVQKARGKTVGKNKVAVNTKADRLLPA